MRKLIIHYNYLVDVYPWRSIIFILVVMGLAGFALVFRLFIISVLFYIAFIFLVTIRTFNDGHKVPESTIGKWFKQRNNVFFMFKRYDGWDYGDFIIYMYNYKENSYLKELGLEQPEYSIYRDSEYGLNLSYSRLANKKEIEEYNLRTLEAKMLLLRDSDERLGYR